MPQPLPPESFDLFDKPHFAVVATVLPDGSPQATVVWIERDGDQAVVFNTEEGRTKTANLERDPRVAITVFDAENPYRYVQVRGQATITAEGGAAHIDKLSRKYLGRDYPAHNPERSRVVVRVDPEAVDLHGGG